MTDKTEEQDESEIEQKTHELMDAVQDRTSFLAFVDALAHERSVSAIQEMHEPSSPYGPQAFGWENITIEDFLAAAVACEEDNPDPSEAPSWQWFADFLYGGKIYE
jgi:hypothetical protein